MKRPKAAKPAPRPPAHAAPKTVPAPTAVAAPGARTPSSLAPSFPTHVSVLAASLFKDKFLAFGLIAALLLGGLARFYRLGYGLPRVVYVDAFRFIADAASIGAGQWDHFEDFMYPGLYKLILGAFCWIAGPTASVGALCLTARVVAACFGVGGIALAFLAARRMGAREGAVIAALLASVCVISTTASRVEATDTILVFFMTSALLVLARERPTLRDFILAGALIGAAAGTKFTGAFAAPFLGLAAAVESRRDGGWRRFLLWTGAGAFAALVVFIACTPWLFWRLPDFAEAARQQFHFQKAGQIGRTQVGWLDYFISTQPAWDTPWTGTSMLSALGLPLMAAGLVGCGAGLSGRWGWRGFFLSLYVALYLALIARPGGVLVGRYLMPILPILFALGGAWAERWLLPRLPGGRASAFALACALLAIYPAAKTARYLRASSSPMTNDAAYNWVASNIPPGSSVFLSPFFTGDLQGLPIKTVLIPYAGMRQYRLPPPGPNVEFDPLYTAALVDKLVGEGVEYLVLNSWFEGALTDVPGNRGPFPISVEGYKAFRARLEETADLAFTVKGWDAGRLGPDIEIYRVRPQSKTPPRPPEGTGRR